MSMKQTHNKDRYIQTPKRINKLYTEENNQYTIVLINKKKHGDKTDELF